MKQTKYILLSVLFAWPAFTPASAQIDENDSATVNMPFRKVAQEDVLGGVSTVNYRELMEKNYNTYTLDNMQGYVAGFNGAGMWGYTDQLVLIDGVPRADNNVKPDEVEDITFLKGAQAVVLYGSRAAKGAILITTKRGKVTDGLRVDVRANTGWAVAKAYPEYLGSAEYMTYYNEARRNDGLGNLYSDADIYNYAAQANPYRYPNLNFYSSDYIKKAYNRSDVTAEIEGGNERAKFYANVSYYKQGDFLNFGEGKNDYTDRFNVRGNVDLRINDFISAYVNANATYYNQRSTRGTNYWEAAASMRPNRLYPLIPTSFVDPACEGAQYMLSNSNNIINGCFLAGTQVEKTNAIADIYAGGRSTWTSRQFQFDAGVNVDLSKLLKGLSFHTLMAIDYATSYTQSYENTYAIFQPTWGNYNGEEVISDLNNYETVDKKTGQETISGSSDNQTITFNAHFDYNRTFNDVHNVSAMLVANGYQTTTSGEYHKVSNANLGLDLSYNYDHRYYGEFGLATPWSAKLPEGHRAGFSPSFTLGWRVTGESFMQNQNIFDDLTISASYSNLKTDLDIENYYMYQGRYRSGDGSNWWDWNGMSSHTTTQSVLGGNDALAFVERNEFSVTLQALMLQRSLAFNASFFTSKHKGGIISATNQMPSYFRSYYPESSFLSYLNYNEDSRSGIDLAVKYKKQFGDFGFEGGLNFTYYTTKATKRDDTNYEDAYQYREGQPLDALWGYECLGFFQDQADIDNSPEQKIGGNIRPGDLKYKDQNGDGIIDGKDQVKLDKGGWYGAPATLGVNLTFKYKNFTLFMLGIGGFGGHAFKSNSYWWVHGDGKYSAVVRDRWTPETAATATYPRLTTEAGQNNFVNSDFWLYSTSRFDLAKVQLTYDFPKSLFDGIFIKGLSVYVSGNSLLTLAKEREILEMNVGSAPQSRFYNLGVKVSF